DAQAVGQPVNALHRAEEGHFRAEVGAGIAVRDETHAVGFEDIMFGRPLAPHLDRIVHSEGTRSGGRIDVDLAAIIEAYPEVVPRRVVGHDASPAHGLAFIAAHAVGHVVHDIHRPCSEHAVLEVARHFDAVAHTQALGFAGGVHHDIATIFQAQPEGVGRQV